jgi:hypothetical protein
MDKAARADVAQIRQTTQFTCCAASIASALKALGKSHSEDDVNKVLGAAPMAGATWESMLATVQYFGCRGTLVVPATPRMLKSWTDRGVPVLIGWNPEGRPWSHASVVFDVTEGPDGKLLVHVMDPNIPNPGETSRVLDEDEFCRRWSEKMSESLIMRRPAMAVELEVTTEGRQVVAAAKGKETIRIDPDDLPKPRHGPDFVQHVHRRPGAGKHHNRDRDVAKGRSRKPKHKSRDREAAQRVASRFLGEEG